MQTATPRLSEKDVCGGRACGELTSLLDFCKRVIRELLGLVEKMIALRVLAGCFGVKCSGRKLRPVSQVQWPVRFLLLPLKLLGTSKIGTVQG